MEDQKQSLESVIRQWVERQPAWYSAALHIVLQGAYTDEQVDALASAACKEQGADLGIESAAALASYQPADLGGAGDSQRSVLLESITAEDGINAIKQGSKLSVSTSGITVVYGNNGSGKSGFSRIMRNSCTSRSGSSEILANVFEGNSTPSAIYDVVVDGVSTSFTWKSGESDYPAFPEIAFFDSACAAMEVSDKDNEILYAPGVISSLMKLPDLVSAVAARIQKRESELIESINMGLVPLEYRGSATMTALLSCKSGAEAEKLVNDARLSPQEEERHAALPKLIAADPDVEIPKLERRQTQLSTMRQGLARLYQCCQPAFVEEYNSALDAVKIAEEAARAAAELASNSSRLDGFGGEVWKTLWEAARTYSNECAHTDAVFPKLSQGSLCPLCQQPLGAEALARMESFEAYVTGLAEKNLTERKKALNTLKKRFLDAVTVVKADRPTIGVLETAQAASSMESLMLELEPITEMPDVVTLVKLSNFIEQAGTQVRAEIDALALRLNSLRENQQPGSADKLKGEFAELNSRSWVYANKDLLIEDAKKRELKASLEAVRKKCSTRQISTLISSASQVEIVEKMQAAFMAELARLKAEDQHVAISTRVRSGQEYQRITLDGVKEPTRTVLSEGEQKIVALAGFFALLDVLPGNSTAVLDDPITSLDHLWRKAVANRIVEVAKLRPIIVFTHEPMFCTEISELSAASGVAVTYRTVQRRGPVTGIVIDELDWDASNVRQRVKLLRNKATDIKRRYKSGEIKTDAELGRAVRDCYSDLRTTWERAVESVLLAGVVQRSQRPVHTKQMSSLTDISDEDIRIVDENMTKCSLLTNAHDDPLASPDAQPKVEDFEADVTVLEEWRKRIETRRQSARKN